MSSNKQLDDYTNFDNQSWNGWEKGPAAAHPEDLVLRKHILGYYLYNRTHTNSSSGIILKKNYSGLVVGATYEFYIDVRRHEPTAGATVPRISLDTNQD